jgi:hypothetical protein
MQKAWKPTAAGIICIIAGAIVVTTAGFIIVAGLASPPSTTGDVNLGMYLIMVFVVGPSITLGIVAIAGGVYAIRRRAWGLALAGAIALVAIGLLVIWILPPLAGVGIAGILSIIFASWGRREFGKAQKRCLGDGGGSRVSVTETLNHIGM